MFKKKFSQDYYDAVDILIRDKYYDSYMCVLFDMSDTLYSMDEESGKKLVKDLDLEDFSYDELLSSDYVVIEFSKYVDMEQYLFRIEHQNIYARFYKMGELFEETPEEE